MYEVYKFLNNTSKTDANHFLYIQIEKPEFIARSWYKLVRDCSENVSREGAWVEAFRFSLAKLNTAIAALHYC